MERTLLFIIAIAAGTQAGPIQEVSIGNQCAKQCSVSNQFNYEAGTSYEFKYENEIRTAVQGASEDHAGLSLSATVNIDFITKCEAVMRLTDVVVKEHDPETSTMKVVSADLKTLLEKDPMGFSYQDGNIEQLCLASDQDVKVLNINRGILSMFQNNMDDIKQTQTVKESDVAGTCDTEYTTAEKGWYNVVVKKSKNMLSCTNRHDSQTALQGIPYDSQSKVQSLPIVKSTHNCHQELVKDSGRLVSASCKEEHMFVPFSRKDGGANTINTQDLTFVGQSKVRTKPVSAIKVTGLHFDHDTPEQNTNTIQDLEDKLQQVCETTKNGVQQETPRLFTSLIYTIKKMEASEIAAVFQKISSKKICMANNERVRKFFLDAIPMAGTPASLKMLTQLLVSNEVTWVEAEMWLTTLAFIQEPTLDMLAEVKPLLTMNNHQEKAMLSVSSLVHSLCRNNPECENYMEVRKIISLLENKIAPACKVTPETMLTTLIALRAIGNAGYGTTVIPTLSKCLKQSSNPIEVRLSAIEAFHRIPCQADKSSIISIFTDMEEDSEVRIAAYKAMMKCPTTDILKKVKVMLGREEVNQVGSYVWSHLTNLMETSDPNKQTIRSIVQDETLQKEFDMDKRKFSRNYEGSFLLEKINTGATVESDLIWSSKSFIPRSAMVNLTVDLFGNAINLFEIGGRMEGLEYFLEQYFGPNGYFSENDVQTAVDESAVQTIKADKAQRINKRMGSVMDELRGSLYMRVFGNELRYMNFDGIDSLLQSNSFNILDILMKLSKENDYQYSHSTMFMDSSLIIPTYSGFPMNLTVNGIATIDIKASGKVDVMKLASQPRGMDIHGMLKPSAALEVTSTMSVDALVTKVGLKMVSSMYTSTAVQGKVSLQDGSILDMEFDLPEEKMEILNVKSSFFTVHRDIEREQQMITDNKKSSKSCTGSKLAKITGIELCGELSYPNASLVENAPYFPLTGPVGASVILYKRDTLTGYKLEARSTHTGDSNIVRLAFSTPNAQVDRAFGVNFDLNKKDGTLDLSLASPFKSANFAGNYHIDKSSASISGKMNVDNSMRSEVKMGIVSEKSGPGMVYTPTLVVQVPGKTLVDLGGSIKYAPWKLIDVDMSLSGIVKPPVKIQASYVDKQKLVRVSASVSTGKNQEYSVDASCQKIVFKKKITYKPQISVRSPSAELLAFGGGYTNIFGKVIKIDATLDKIISSPIILKKAVFGVKQYSRGRKLYNVNVDLKSSLMDLKMKSKFDNRNMKTLGTDIDLTYVIRKVARDNIKFVSKVINLSSKALTKLRTQKSFTSKLNPDYNVKLVANLDHNKKHSQIDADIRYGPNAKDTNKQISMLVSLDKAIRSWSKASAEFTGEFRKGNDLRIVSKLKHQHDPKSLDTNVNFRLNKNAATASISLKDQSDTLKNLEGQFELSLPGKTILVSQSLKETQPSTFVSVMNAKIGKMKNQIETTWIRKSPSELSLSAKLDLYNIEPMVIQGDYNFSPKMLTASGTIEKGSNKYSISTSTKMISDNAIEASADIQYPTRRIVANFEQTMVNDLFTSMTDLRWNADKDDSQRAVIKTKGKMTGLDNIDGSVTIQYPSRNIAFNVKHFAGKKYNSHIDMQWEQNEVYAVDTVFGQYEKDGMQETEGQFKLSTPFKTLKQVSVTVNQQTKSSEFKTKVDVEWNPNNLISSTITIDRPISLKSFNAEIIAKTPFDSLKYMQASLRHRMNNGISTVGTASWNKQSAQIDVSLDNTSDDRKSNVRGVVNLKTSFNSLKTAKLNVEYFNDGSKLQTTLGMLRNKQVYGLTTSIKHNINGWNINNNGELKINSPSEEFTASWDHMNTLSDIKTSADITWGKNKHLNIKYSGLQHFREATGSLSSALEVKSSFRYLSDVVAQISHEHRSGQIDSSMTVISEGTKIASAEGKYLRKNGQIQSSIAISNPISGGDITVNLVSAYEAMPKTVHMDIQLSPQKSISLDGSYSQDMGTNIASSISISSPLFNDINLKGTRQVTSNGIVSVASLDYAPGKIIRIQSLHSLNEDKFMKISFQSPYTRDYTAEIGVKGTLENFQARCEALPFLKRWTATGSFDRRTGINLRVNTPYPEVAYSQVAIRSEKVNGDRTSSITIEYMPGQIVKMISAYNFENLKNLKFSIGLESPFEGFHKSVFEITHRGPLNKFANHMLLEYKPGQTISLDTALSCTSGIDGSIVVVSPWTDAVKSMMKVTGNLEDFTAHGELTWKRMISFDLKHKGSLAGFSSAVKLIDGEDILSGNVAYTSGPKTTTDISIRTPYESWKTIKITHILEGNMEKFNTHFELSATKFGTYSTDVNVDVTAGVNGEIAIQTPMKGLDNLKASLAHAGTPGQFNTNVELQQGSKKFSGNVKLSTKPAINAAITIKTPFKEYQLSQITLKHDGSAYDFKTNLEIQLNKDISEVDLSYNFVRKLNVDLAIRSPYFNDVKISFDHWGKLSRFTTKLRARSGKQRLSSDVEFQLNPSLNVQVSFKSPFALLKNQQFSIKHAGSMDSFKCNMQYRCNGNMYLGDATFQNIDNMKGEINLKGPEFKPVNVAFDLRHGNNSFMSTVQASTGKKIVKADAYLDIQTGMTGKLAFSTPFDGLESITASVSHKGSLSNFKSQGEFSINSKQSSVLLSFDNSKAIIGSVEIITPLQNFNLISSSVRHTGSMANMETNAQFKLNEKSIDVRASFEKGNTLTMSTSLISKFSSVPNMDASLSYNGGVNTRGEVNVGKQKVDFETVFNAINDGYIGKMSLNMPWIKRTTADFNLHMTQDSFTTECLATYDGVTKFRLVSDKTPVSVTITVNTPLEKFETTVLNLVFSKNINSLTTEASLRINKDTHEGRLSFIISPNVDGTFTIKSPLIKDVAVTMSVNGKATNFKSQFETKYDRKSILSSEFDLKIDGPFSGDLKIVSPLMKNIKASFNFDGTLKNFKSDASFAYAGQKSEGTVSVNLLNEVQCSIRISTPITDDLEVTLTGRGSLPNAIVTSDLMYGGKSKFRMDANLNLEETIDSHITVKTPFSGFSHMGASFSLQGTLPDFKTIAELVLEDNTASFDISFNSAAGNILIKSPLLKDIEVTFVNNGKLPSIRSNAQLLYGTRNLFNLKMKCSLPTEGVLEVTSPIFNDQPVSVTYNIVKKENGFDSHAEISIYGEKHEADLSIDMTRQCKASIKTPRFAPVSFTFDHDKMPSSVSSSVALEVGSSKQHVSVSANIENGLDVSMYLKSDFMPEIRLTCNANNDLMNLKANANLEYNTEDILSVVVETESDEKLAGSIRVMVLGNQAHMSVSGDGKGYENFNVHVTAGLNKHTLEGDLSFSKTRNIIGAMNFKSSFTRPVSASVNYENDEGDYHSRGDIMIDSAKHEYDMQINTKNPYLTKLSITSPAVEPISASVSVTGSLKDFVFESELMYGNSKASANAGLNVESAFKGNLDVATPLTEPLEITFDHSGSISNFKTLTKSTYGADTVFDTEITWAVKPLQGKIQINTMLPGYESILASFKHDGDMLSFTNHAELDISGDKSEVDISLNAATKLEGRLNAKSPHFPTVKTGFEFTGTPSKFVASVDFSLDDNTYSLDTSLDMTNDIIASFKLTSPINGYRTITGKLSHAGALPNIVSSVELKSGRRNLALGSLDISAINGYAAKMSAQSSITPAIQVNLGHTGYITNFKSVADIRYNGEISSVNVEFKSDPSLEGSYTISTPWKKSSGNLNVELKQNAFDVKANTRLDDETMTFGMAYQGGNNMGLTFNLQTPFAHFEQLSATANLNKRHNGFNAEANVELPSSRRIEMTAQLRGMNGNFVLKTPFDGLKYSAIETTYSGQFPNVASSIKLTVFDKTFSVEGELDGLNGKLSVSTPLEGYKNTALSFNAQGRITDMKANVRLTAVNKEIFASFENKMAPNSIETKARLETPDTEDLMFELTHTGSMYDFYNSVLLSMGPSNSLTSATTFKFEPSSMELESTLSTVLTGYSDEQKVKLNFEQAFPDYKTTAFAKILGSEYTLDSSLDTKAKIIGKLSLKTPFQKLSDVSVELEHSGDLRRFETKTLLGLNSEKLSTELSYMKYGWRRLQTALVVETSFKGFEKNTVSYRHTASIDSFECNADASVLSNDFTGTLTASKEPLKAQITITTPFSGYQQVGADMKMDISAGIYNAEANFAFTQDKTISVSTDINVRDSPKLVSLKISTPFSGYETTDIQLTHSGDYLNFQSMASVSTPFTPALRAQANLRSSSLSSFDGKLVLNSQLKNFENIELNFDHNGNLGKYKTNIETRWAPGKSISFNTELTDYRNSMSADLSLSTPFESVRQFSLKAGSKMNGNQYSESIVVKHNQETCIDMDLNIDTSDINPSSLLVLREPTSFRAEVGATISKPKYTGRIQINDDLNIEASHDISTKRTELKYECLRHSVLLKNQMSATNPKADVFINNAHYGYEVSMMRSDGSVKVIFPSRSLKLTGSHNQGKTEGAFMWDADKDESKMVGIKSELTKSADSVKADVTLQMPTLGKDVHIDSEMVLNRGQVIFEHKTDFTYSKDSRKTITLTSRLVDISNDWNTKNYSFSLGLQHPFTTVGMQLSSHLGKSMSEYTGGIDLEYLTARQETKTFSVNGEINKLRHSAKLNMNTPLKKISISGDSKLQNPFSVSLVNQYDDKRPLSTLITLDAQMKKIGLQMNYDLENPSSEFHISAKYMNDSAILGEVSHVVNRQKVTDALMFLRLNNSHLLHSRLHWRPTAIKDLSEYVVKKSNAYHVQLAQMWNIVSASVKDEVHLKSAIMSRAVKDEMRPFAEVMDMGMEELVVMYEHNTYHLRDIVDEMVHLAIRAEENYETVSMATGEKMELLVGNVQEISRSASAKLQDVKTHLTDVIVTKLGNILEPLYNATQHPAVVSLGNKVRAGYITYMDQLNSLSEKVPTMADSYSSAIYGARDSISSGLNSILARDDVKYVKSYTDPMVYQGQNAYKYWEVRENIKMVVDAIIDMIIEDIEKELSDIKASVFSLTKTTFTVYDPVNGEIQADIHLPIPLRSLDEIPVIDVAPYMTKVEQYKAKLPGMPQISTDVSTWIPPYDAYATIHGDKVTTFDGTVYDLDGSCSFLLAKDFVDGNFSLVLHKEDNTKSLLIMADGKAITIQTDGKVLVDGKPVEMPVTLKNISISSVDNVETVVKGAGSFEVSYSPLSDLTTVKLSGWYFGKTSGVLGTFDNEPSNDFMSSYGRPINNPSRFARTWDLSLTKCR